jgi:hypothetical protein
MRICILGSFLLLQALRGTASGSALLVDQPSDCARPATCDAVTIRGKCAIDDFPSGDDARIPFTVQVRANEGNCLRLDVTAVHPLTISFPDLEMVLVSPDGAVWRNDNRSLNNINPLITIVAPDTGFYTLQVSNVGDGFPGGSGFPVDFTLKYGLYNSSEGHCNSLTPEE